MTSIFREHGWLVYAARMLDRERIVRSFAAGLAAAFFVVIAPPVGADSHEADAAAEAAPAGGSAGKAPREGKAKAKQREADRHRAEAQAKVRALQKERRAEQSERYEALDLTDAQREAIESLPDRRAEWRAEHDAALVAFRDRILAARAEGDLETVRRLTAERQELMAGQPSMDAILTAEQQRKLQASFQRPARGDGAPPHAGHGKKQHQKLHQKKAEQSPLLRDMQEQMREARLAGDQDRVVELQKKLRELRRAVRAEQAAARKKEGAE